MELEELWWATGPRFTTTGSTQIFMRARHGVNVFGDFQIAPKTTGLQGSIISVGRVADKGKIIVFHKWTIFIEVTGNRIEFERVGGVCRLKDRDISTESDWERWNQDAVGLRARVRGLSAAQLATPGTVLDLASEIEVEQLEARIDTPTISKLLSPLRTC